MLLILNLMLSLVLIRLSNINHSISYNSISKIIILCKPLIIIYSFLIITSAFGSCSMKHWIVPFLPYLLYCGDIEEIIGAPNQYKIQ